MSFGDWLEEWARRRWWMVLVVAVWFGGLGLLVRAVGWPFLVWVALALATCPAFVWMLRSIRDRWPALDPFKVEGVGEDLGDSGDVSVYAGQLPDGSPLWVSAKNRAAAVLTGVPGTGKTVLLRQLVLGLVEAGAKVTVVDLKAGGDFALFEGFGVDVVEGEDLGEVVETLESLEAVRGERTARLRSLPVRNWWDHTRATRGPLRVLVVDEAQGLFEVDGLAKAEKDLMLRGTAAVRQLVKLGRSAGVFVILSTQKADTKAIPSSIRDQADLRIAGRVNTREAARASLGELAEEGQPSPLDLPAGVPGWFVLRGQFPVDVMFNTPYLSDADISARLRRLGGGSI